MDSNACVLIQGVVGTIHVGGKQDNVKIMKSVQAAVPLKNAVSKEEEIVGDILDIIQ